ncbi:MAG: AAA family ATPase [Candidatus Nanoarchaeia archaeon]
MATVIGIVGMPASGKTIVAEHLAKKPGALRIHLGDFVWDWLKRRGVKPSEEAGLMASLYLWAEYGDIPIAQWAMNQVKKAKNKKFIILDSLRTVEEARIFQLKFGEKFHIIAVLASPAVRLKRAQARARFGPLTKLEFRMRDREELRLGVGDLIASSNHYIDGNQSVQSVKKQADAILKHLT